MKVALYSIHSFEKTYLEKANDSKHDFKYIPVSLSLDTVVLSAGCDAISIFVSDDASASVLQSLHKTGVRYLALRSAGYNHVDLAEAKKLNFKIARVPEYSPYSVAEHCIALLLALNRRLIRAHNRVMDQNFSLDGLVGFDLHGKTVGLIGAGKIGSVVAKILHGFGCRILIYDLTENAELREKYNVEFTSLDKIYAESDIISLHLPLTPETKYLINKESIARMKTGVMILNTSRGALINTKDAIKGLKTGKIGYLGIDVYEEEAGLFFEDHSDEILKDDTIARLMTFNNVLITSHQAFLTNTALENIALTTVQNITAFENGDSLSIEL